MSDDLIGTAEAAEIIGVRVGTVNRWAAEGVLEAAVTLPGKTGARLYRRSDVEAYKALREHRRTKAVEYGACETCTTEGVQTWHSGPCPNTEQVAS